ncbi:MAG: xanthine dehydrogenase family protein subunit M [Calditrichaeota bacterium]|nr:MAG: xanthine dehydrogenase family protein subunit M [Calditrichota bacterium]
MIPPSFEYFSPASLAEAISLLDQYGEEAKILSGGHSLIPMMKLRLATPQYLVDINGISDLEYIRESGGYLRIGGLTREVALEDSELIRTRYPIIYDTAKMIADPQVRNLATVGGNLAHGDPANDHPATMIALGAEIVATGPGGERPIPIDDFFVGLFETALQPNEILTEIRIPVPPKRSGGAYLKLERKAGDFAIAGVAVQLTLSKKDVCERIGIGLTNVGITPLRAKRSQDVLMGQKPDDRLIDQAAQLASEDCEPTDDLRGTEEYKRAMVKELTRRALRLAIQRAKGGQ